MAPDALVGLAGPYDIRNFSDAAANLFAPDADDATWDAANPVLLAARRPEVPVLLLHGDADELVPAQFSQDFAAALRAGGHHATLSVLPGREPRRGLLGAGRGRPGRPVAARASRRTDRRASAGPHGDVRSPVVASMSCSARVSRWSARRRSARATATSSPMCGDLGVDPAAPARAAGGQRLGRVGEQRDRRGGVVALLEDGHPHRPLPQGAELGSGDDLLVVRGGRLGHLEHGARARGTSCWCGRPPSARRRAARRRRRAPRAPPPRGWAGRPARRPG